LAQHWKDLFILGFLEWCFGNNGMDPGMDPWGAMKQCTPPLICKQSLSLKLATFFKLEKIFEIDREF
jgi:hypothetical protein